MLFCFCWLAFKADDVSAHSFTALFKVLTMSQVCAVLAAVGTGTDIRPDHALKNIKNSSGKKVSGSKQNGVSWENLLN